MLTLRCVRNANFSQTAATRKRKSTCPAPLKETGKKQLRSATAARVRRHNSSQCGCARIVCVICMCFVFVPRHKVVNVILRRARRCGQSPAARRRGAERSELLHLFRCDVVAVGLGGCRAWWRVLCSFVLRDTSSARALRRSAMYSAK